MQTEQIPIEEVAGEEQQRQARLVELIDAAVLAGQEVVASCDPVPAEPEWIGREATQIAGKRAALLRERAHEQRAGAQHAWRRVQRFIDEEFLVRDGEAAALIPDFAVAQVLRFVAVQLSREPDARARGDRPRDDRGEQRGVERQEPPRPRPRPERRDAPLEDAARHAVRANRHPDRQREQPPPAQVIAVITQRRGADAHAGDRRGDPEADRRQRDERHEPPARSCVDERRGRMPPGNQIDEAVDRQQQRERDCGGDDQRRTAGPREEVVDAVGARERDERAERGRAETHTGRECRREPPHEGAILSSPNARRVTYCYPIGDRLRCYGFPIGARMADKADVWQGTLALMILKTLETLGPLHGYGIARRIEQTSGDRLSVNYGTIYPALLKLEQEGYIDSEWGVSDNNRKAKFYRLTRAGRRQLAKETREWERTTAILARFLSSPEGSS